tara:strand:- start:4736 stop:5479 length:744 start_codon:yes stop_codon:yes gene_type:complete
MEQFIGFIPSTLNSPTRLPGKAITEIEGMPIIVHVAKRASLSSNLKRTIVCTDSDRIVDICRKYNIEVVLTNNEFRNGTERIASIANEFKFKYAIDISGDEPLVDPDHIDIVANRMMLKDNDADIVIPTLEVPYSSPETIIRVQCSKTQRIMTLTRSYLPNRFSNPTPFIQKHLPLIGFTRNALLQYGKLEPTFNEECENIAMLRALENDMHVFAVKVESDSYSLDIQDDILKARVAMKNDKYLGSY